MASRIKLKRSTTPSVVPSLSDLTDGELGINIADGILYANSGGIKSLNLNDLYNCRFSGNTLFFDAAKLASISSDVEGLTSFDIDGAEQGGFNSYGVFSNKNLTVYSRGISQITIDNEGSEYEAGQYTLNAVTNPTQVATATASLDLTNGSLKTLTLTNPGSNYTATPQVVIGVSNTGTNATANAILNQFGTVIDVTVSSGGSGYTSPTIEFSGEYLISFDVSVAIDAVENTISSISHNFENDDQVIYSNNGGSENIGLIDGSIYFVINKNQNTFQLSSASGGAAVSLTTGSSSEFHTISARPAEATVNLLSGAVDSITVTYPGIKYSLATAVINDATGSGALVDVVVGKFLSGISISENGDGYTSTPSVTINNNPNDSYGSGATASAQLGYPLDSIVVTNQGIGYSSTPLLTISGGSPDSDASPSVIFNKRTGKITEVNIEQGLGGFNYSSVPTLTFIGGRGSDAQLEVNILPLIGTITSGGSGYAAGQYIGVPFVGGSPSTPATATFTVIGLGGSVTNTGSGYTNSVYESVPLLNSPTATFAVTTQQREIINISYVGNTYEWNVVNNGTSSYDFTLVSSTGTPSGSNISITAESHDTLIFNVSASGHPFYIQNSPGPYNPTNVVVDGVTNVGSDSGIITWDLSRATPGTYYYVCGIHGAMTGTITVSAYTGSTFTLGDTITGSTSGASAVVSYVGDNFVRFSSVTNGPFLDGEPISNGTFNADIITPNGVLTQQVIFIDGNESPQLTLNSHNTYRFDISDSTAIIPNFNNFLESEINRQTIGSVGTPNSYVQLVLTDDTTLGSNYYYGSGVDGNYITISDGSSSPGVYGFGASATVEVTSGQVSNFEFGQQGSKYKINDVLTAENSFLGGTGSGFEYTIQTNDTSISSITEVSISGGPYTTSDILTVDSNFDSVGNGSGFQYTLTKTGFVDSVNISNPGFGYFVGEQTFILQAPSTTGTEFELSVTGTEESVPIEVQYDGGITALNWNVDTNGNATFVSVNLDNLQTDTIINSGSLSTNSLSVTNSTSTNSLATSTATVSTSLTAGQLQITSINGNLTTSGVIKSTTGGFNSNDDLTIINSTIATTTGNQLVLDPATGETVKVDALTALVIPVGDTSNRPATPESGSIRFNSEISQFEGYDGNNGEWVSVGGVKDVDGNTYIAAETVPGANENILYFYNDDLNTLNITTSSIDLEEVSVLNANNVSGLEVNGNVNIKDDLTFDTTSEGRILLDDGTVLIPALSFVDQERTGLILTDNQTALSVTSVSGQIVEFGSTELSIFRNTTFNKLDITSTSFVAGSGYTEGQYNATSFEGGTGDGLVADVTIAFEVSVSTPGVGYDVATYENIPLDITSGTGSGAIANITVDGTTGVTEVTIINSGNAQYQVGDTVSTTYTNMQYDDGQGNLITTAQPTTDFEFTVTAVGAITVLNITDNGEGYRDLDVLTVPTSVIGAGTGFELTILTTATTEEVNISKDDGSITSKSLVVSTPTGIDINGDLSITNSSISRTTAGNLELTAQTGNFVRVTGTGALLVPAGNTAQRPGNALAGGIRYNTQESRFEGFNGSYFVSLGGVRDVDGNTYISAELNPGDDDNIIRFVNDGVQSMQVEQNKITLQTINLLDVTNIDGVTEWEAGASATAPADPINDPPVLVYFGTNVYSVDTTGTFDAVNGPTHTTGTVTNGTVDLTWVRTIYQNLNFTAKDFNLNIEQLDLNFNTLKFFGDSTAAYIGSESTELNVAFGSIDDPFIKILNNGTLAINNGFGGTSSFINVLDKDLQKFDLKDTRVFSSSTTLDTSVGNAVNVVAFPYTESHSGKFMIEIVDDSGTPRRQYSEISYLVKSDGSDILYTENNKLYTDVELCGVSVGIDGSNNITVDIVDATSSSTTVFSIKVVSQTILA